MQQRIFIPEGLTVNHPFFYIIQHIPSGKYYAGYCCKKSHCDSKKFMSEGGYQTSSKIVKEFIKNEGLSTFTILKIKHFEFKTDAIDYEVRFLKRVKARRNKMFLNQTEGDKNLITKIVTEDARKKMSEAKRGIKRGPMSEEHKRKIGKSNSGKTPSDETIKKLKESHIGKVHSNKTKMKMSETHKLRNSQCSEEIREKRRQSMLGRVFSEESKQKMRESAKNRIKKTK